MGSYNYLYAPILGFWTEAVTEGKTQGFCPEKLIDLLKRTALKTSVKLSGKGKEACIESGEGWYVSTKSLNKNHHI